jgi:endo-1,4-beta-xylanase
MNSFTRRIFFLLIFTSCILLNAQNVPVIIEAENGILGDEFNTLTDGDVTYVTPLNDNPALSPGVAGRVITFNVNFTDSGTYRLFFRIRVGSGAGSDDSYFYGNGFGTKDAASDPDWITCNQMNVAGFSIPSDVVEGQGAAINQIWKWICVSDYAGYDPPITFRVEEGSLTQTFQIGSRENGLDIDKIAFGRAGLYFTVSNLDNGEAGSLNPPGEFIIGPPLAYGLDKFLGCAFGPDSRTDFAGYWNQVTPGNAGKWGWVEGTRDNMVWTDLDEAYQVAMDNNYFYKHHVLVWGNQQPAWIETLDSAEQRAEIEEWFSAVAERYPDVDQIEVVNEPLHDPPNQAGNGGGNYIQALGGNGVTGWDWIIEAFRLARQTFADSVSLMINEYSIINSTTSTDQYRDIIDLLQADSLIDAIGIQGHAFSQDVQNYAILRNLDTLAATGLPIYVTEMDVDGETDLKQVRNYMRLFPLFWEYPAIKGITLWGFRPGMWRTDTRAYLIDAQGNERPAMLWLRAYLMGEFIPNETINVTSVSGATAIEVEAGTLQLQAEILPDTSTLQTVYWSVNDADIATVNQNGLITAVSDGTVTVNAISLEYNSTVKGSIEITISGQPIESIAEAKNSMVNLYPNPADKGWFMISGIENAEQINIIDINGHIIRSIDAFNLKTVEIQLDPIPGLYMVQIIELSGTTYRKVIVN